MREREDVDVFGRFQDSESWERTRRAVREAQQECDREGSRRSKRTGKIDCLILISYSSFSSKTVTLSYQMMAVIPGLSFNK